MTAETLAQPLPTHSYDRQHPEPGSPAAELLGERSRLQLVLGALTLILATVASAAISALVCLIRTGAAPDLGALMGGDRTAVAGIDLLIGRCVSAALAVGLYLVVMRRVARRPGLGLRGRGAMGEFVVGLLIGIAMLGVVFGIVLALGGWRVTGTHLTDGILAGLASGIGAAFVEEIFFRGFFLRILQVWSGTWAALMISAVLFGAAHLSVPGATWWSATAIALQAGILLGAAYLLTHRLWLGIGIHMAWNAAQTALFSMGDVPGLLALERLNKGPLTGGSSGIEASPVTVGVCLVVAVVLLLLSQQRGRLATPRHLVADDDGTGERR